MSAKISAKLDLLVEGCDEEGRVQLGAPASLVIEGLLPPKHKPKDCVLLVTVATTGSRDAEEAQFTLGVDDFLEGSGPFLCQIDFEAEVVGQMDFSVDMLAGDDTLLAQAKTSLRIVNTLRDPSGKRRKTGAGALKVKK